MTCNLKYRTEVEDGVTLHIFDGTVLERDFRAMDEFVTAHAMTFHSFGTGYDGEQGFEDFECFTTDADAALQFKLTFGGA